MHHAPPPPIRVPLGPQADALLGGVLLPGVTLIAESYPATLTRHMADVLARHAGPANVRFVFPHGNGRSLLGRGLSAGSCALALTAAAVSRLAEEDRPRALVVFGVEEYADGRRARCVESLKELSLRHGIAVIVGMFGRRAEAMSLEHIPDVLIHDDERNATGAWCVCKNRHGRTGDFRLNTLGA